MTSAPGRRRASWLADRLLRWARPRRRESARTMVGDGQRPKSSSRLWPNSCASSVVLSLALSLRKSYSNGSCRKCRSPTTPTTASTATTTLTAAAWRRRKRASGPRSSGARAGGRRSPGSRRSSSTSMRGQHGVGRRPSRQIAPDRAHDAELVEAAEAGHHQRRVGGRRRRSTPPACRARCRASARAAPRPDRRRARGAPRSGTSGRSRS